MASVTAANSGTAWVGSVGWRSLGLPYRRLSCPSKRSAPASLCHQLLSLSLCDPLGPLYRETGLCHARGQRVGGKGGRSLLGSIAQSPPIPGAEAGRGWGLHSQGPGGHSHFWGLPKSGPVHRKCNPSAWGPELGWDQPAWDAAIADPIHRSGTADPATPNFHCSFFLVAPIVLCAGPLPQVPSPAPPPFHDPL